MRDHVREQVTPQSHRDRAVRSPPAGGGSDTSTRKLRLGAKGLITARGQVLLIKEQHADGTPFWTIPGGGVETDESLTACLCRELEEEIRCGATVGEVLDSYLYTHTSRPVTTLYAVFETTLDATPEPNDVEQIIDHAWRPPSDLPAATLEPVADLIREVSGTDSG